MGIYSGQGKKSKEGLGSDEKRKQLLQEFELKYHKLIDTANYAIFIADAKTGFILDANKKAGELIGVSPDRIIGMHQSKLHPPEEAKRYKKIFQEHIKSGKAISEDVFVIHKSGDKIPVEISASIVEIGGKRIIQGIFRDMTERKKVEDELAQSEKKYRDLADNALVGVYQTNLKGDILYANEAMAKITGAKSPAKMRSINVSMKYKDPKVREKLIRVLKEKGRVDNFEIEGTNENGELKNLLISSTLEGDVISGVMMDITERKKAEEKMAALSRFPEENPLPVLRIAKDGTVLYSNEAGQSMLKHFRSEVGGPIKGELKNSVVNAYKSGKDGEIEVKYDDKVFLVDIVLGTDLGYVNLYGSDIAENKKAEDEIKSSRKRLLTILDGINALVYVTDMKTYELLFVNKYGRDVWGDIAGKICWETLQEGQSGPCSFCTNKYLVDKKGNPTGPYEWEFQNTVNNRSYFIIDRAIDWYDGRIVRLEIATDITERKKAEEELRESEERFRKIFEEGPLGMMLTGLDLRFVKVNLTLSRMLGYSGEELLNLSFPDITHPDDIAKDVENAKKLANGEIVFYNTEKRYIRKDKEIIWISLTATLICDEDEKPLYFLTMVEDITERKKVEIELREISRSLREAQSLARIGSWSWDVDTDSVNWSEELYNITGLNPKNPPPLYEEHSSLYTEDSWRELSQAVEKTVQKGEPYELELDMVRPTGEIIQTNTRGKAAKDKTGRVVKLYGTVQDITERKKAEDAMHESEDKFRTLAEKSPNMIFINKQGKVVFANEKCEEVMGYSREEFYSPEFDFMSLIAPEDKGLVGDNFKSHMKGEEVEPYEYTLVARNGKRIDVLQTSKLIEYEGGTALLGIITDISERKKFEKELEDKIDELEKWQRLTVGRELRMTDLKEELEELKKRLGKYEHS